MHILNLPPSILREIFVQYLTLQRPKNWSMATVRFCSTTFATPVPLSHVCALWRKVACSSPVLWSSIFVIGPSAKQLPLVELWLKRSKGAALTLAFRHFIRWETPRELLDATNGLFRLFGRHSTRWRKIYFDFSHPDLPLIPVEAVELFSAPIIRNLPLLESAKVIENSNWHVHPVLDFWLQLYQNQSLRSAAGAVPGFRVGPAGLTEIFCHLPWRVEAVLFTLASCHNLKSFDITLLTVAQDDPGPQIPSFMSPSLRKLRLRNRANRAAALPIFLRLTAPKLAELDVCVDGSAELFGAFNDMILRSKCSLTYLAELDVNVSTKKFIQLLRLPQLQGLRQLAIRNANAAILKALTLQPGASILPFLKDLEIDDVVSPLGPSLSNLLLSRFDSLKDANIVGDPNINQVPLADKLWSHPGYSISYRDGPLFRQILWDFHDVPKKFALPPEDLRGLGVYRDSPMFEMPYEMLQ